MVRELDLVRWVCQRAPENGDDCSVLECGGWGTLLVTTDSVIDGVHAHWDEYGPAVFGYKAVARGMSDVAAMGGEPLWALIAACLPDAVSEEQARAVVTGAEGAGCRLVGGDTAFGPTTYVVGTVLGRAHPKGPVLRSGARPGDQVFVSGALGGAVASGRHASFRPRVEEARRLMDACDVHAMIDLSDGLATDLRHILEASQVGCRLEAARVPCNGVPLEQALSEGEDYELVATMASDQSPPAGFVRIGTILDNPEFVLIGEDGKEEPVRIRGYEHGSR